MFCLNLDQIVPLNVIQRVWNLNSQSESAFPDHIMQNEV